MAIDYTAEIDGNLLSVTTSGCDDKLDESVNYAESILGLCLENSCNAVLIDERKLTGVLDKVETYEMIKRLQPQIPYDLKIAYVVSPEYFDDVSFGVLVAENRGIRVQAFLAGEPALKWLQEQA